MENTPDLKQLYKGGKESILGRVATESLGPVRSFLLYIAYKISGGKIRPDLSTYFGPRETRNIQQNVSLKEISGVLDDIDKRLIGGDEVPENFISEDYQKWSAVKSQIIPHLDSGTTLTDYVLLDKQKNHRYIFIVKDSKLLPIEVGADNFDTQNLKTQLANNEWVEIPDKTTSDDLSNAINTELAISDFIQSREIKPENCVLRRICSVTNDFSCQRHAIFDREGQMFTDLRHMGAWSLGEFRDLHRVLFSRGIYFDSQKREVVIDQELAKSWVKLRKISLQQENELGEKQAVSEMQQYAREKLYFEMTLHYFRENPQLVDLFLQTQDYHRFAMEFKDKNIAALGLTERACAGNMFANYYLLMFEGGVIDQSRSQAFLARIPSFHQTISTFVDSHHDVALPTPQVASLETDQRGALENLFKLLKRGDYPFIKTRLDSKQKTEVVNKAEDCFTSIQHQIRRNKFNQAVLTQLGQRVPVAKKGVFSTVIANFGLAKVPGEKRFTMSSWFPHADQYLPEGNASLLVPLTEISPSTPELSTEIRHIFNGKIAEGHTAYVSQEKRIFDKAFVIFSYLQNNPEVPENVRNFIKTLGTPDLAIRILERFGSIADNDPLVVNRFFPDGFAEFQKSAIYRYVFEFVRGVETNLILATSKSPKEKALRKFGGRWKNHDFSTVDEIILIDAIKKTTTDASHRIDILNHEQGVKRTTLKDWQEHFEKMFGWDTFDMWFLRWEKFWDVWNTLGGTWDCICFSRKSIFNPRTLQQW